MDHPLPPQHHDLRTFLRRYGARTGCLDVSTSPDGETTIDFGEHGQIHGPTRDPRVWESALDLAQAICYRYQDLPTNSSTRQVLNHLTHPSNDAVLSGARRSVAAERSRMGDYVDMALDDDSAQYDLRRVTDVVRNSHRVVLAREDLGALTAQVQALCDNLNRVLDEGSRPQAKVVASALSAACDDLREQINDVDDAAEHLTRGR